MTVQELSELDDFTIICEGDTAREIECLYCCDLLSIVMSKAPSDCAWVTVMGNINAVAVASLADMACVILAEGAVADDIMITKAEAQGINVLKTQLPVFEAAMLIHNIIKQA